jgi:hypothetical protein
MLAVGGPWLAYVGSSGDAQVVHKPPDHLAAHQQALPLELHRQPPRPTRRPLAC